MKQNKKPWEMSTYDYIGHTSLPDKDSKIVKTVYEQAEKHFAQILEQIKNGKLILKEGKEDICQGYSLRYLKNKSPAISGEQAVFVNNDTGEVVGSPRLGLHSPYVVPEHRCRGITSGFNFKADMERKAFRTLGYTPEGLESRAATHRLHIEKALERGDHVPSEVLDEYLIDENGRVTREERYTPEVYNAEKERREEAKVKPDHSSDFDF